MNLVRFRDEAVAAQADTLFGAPLIAQPPRVAVLVVALVVASASFLAFAGWAQYTRKEHVVGYLAPTRGLIKVFTPQAGTVLERRVAEGQTVRQGVVRVSERSLARARATPAAVRPMTEGAKACAASRTSRQKRSCRQPPSSNGFAA
jgi:membrane fusion protein